MAGDWIKMRVNLVAHPKVLRLAEMLLGNRKYVEWSVLSFGLNGYPPLTGDEATAERHAALRVTRYVCVTSLLRFWGYANEHAKGEHIDGLTMYDLDEIVGVPGFGAALESVGWVEFSADGGVELPGFGEHNTSAEVRKSGAAERQKAYRDRQKLKAESDVTRDVTSHAREEKRREEKKEPPKAPKGVDYEPDGFRAFWAAWPKSNRKGGRDKCLALWREKRYEGDAAAIVTHVEAMTNTPDWSKENRQYVPAPVVYLRSTAWTGAELSGPMVSEVFAGAR